MNATAAKYSDSYIAISVISLQTDKQIDVLIDTELSDQQLDRIMKKLGPSSGRQPSPPRGGPNDESL
jgi:hypothetical protein